MELFITDLDGTLLNSKAEVSEYTVNALNRLIGRGMNFTAATARSLTSAHKILGGINLKLPIILMNGVLIYDPANKKYEVVNKLSGELVSTITNQRRKLNLDCFMYTITDGEMLTYYERLSCKAMVDFYEERCRKYYKAFKQNDNFESVDADVIYFTFIDQKEKLQPLFDVLKSIEGLELTFYNDVYSEGLWYLEVFSAKASKRSGVKYLREKYGFDKITAFGDNTNDLPMLEEADTKIAVRNANKKLLEYCGKIIDSNENDGVAKYLEGIFDD